MRLTLTTLMLMTMLGAGHNARAEDRTDFDAVAELPAARVICLGEAALPEMLRFAFQPEPEGDGRPEIVRVADTRRGSRPPAAQARPALRQPGLPLLRLPCIRG
ncbi:MAG: hypothetical protein H7345_05080 [Rubritepida sp.]|nr:hypothetical protein [Rubritepida sp.]